MYWLDILIVLGIGAFVASRFFAFKLPKDDTPKASRRGWQEVLDKLQPPDPNQAADFRHTHPNPKPAAKSKAKPSKAVAPIAEADPTFTESTFLEGALKAYDYFYDRYNALDLEGLDNLCGPQLMAELEDDIAAHQAAKTKPRVEIEGTPEAKITASRVTGRTAIVTVAFAATHREDPRATPKQVKQSWVFARALTSGDPNWELQSIQHRADA